MNKEVINTESRRSTIFSTLFWRTSISCWKFVTKKIMLLSQLTFPKHTISFSCSWKHCYLQKKQQEIEERFSKYYCTNMYVFLKWNFLERRKTRNFHIRATWFFLPVSTCVPLGIVYIFKYHSFPLFPLNAQIAF